MKKAFTITLILFALQSATGQTPSNNMLYENFWSAGLNITNSGYNFNYTRGIIPNAKTYKFYEIEFASIHHPKEYKQTRENLFQPTNVPNPKPFVYGKQYSFFNLNVSYGIYKELGRRAERSGVSVGMKAAGGISLGILKPYYLVLIYPIDNSSGYLEYEKYSDANKNYFLDINSIYGGGNFTQGITEIKFIPGVHSKLGFQFDYAVYDEYIKAIEAGVFLNVYYKNTQIMLIEKRQQFYPGIYVGFEFGKKS